MKEKIKNQKGFIQIPLLIIIVVSIVIASVGTSLYFHEKEKSLATINESILTTINEQITEESECPTCPESQPCEPEEIIKEVPIEKIVIKEIPADCPTCPTCSDCSDEQNLINSLQAQIASLQNQITSLQSQIQSLTLENQSLKEQIQVLQSTPTQPVNQYSDLQPIIDDVPKYISGSPPQTGGTVIKLLSLSNLGGRSFQLRKIVFTTNDNPQFYSLKACNPYRSGSCDGWGEPVFGNNGSYYWEGAINISSAWNINVGVAKQGCKPELNNCNWTQLNINVNLADWILWDSSTNKQVKLTGQYTIMITAD